jgi:hypothetical protein
VRWPPSPPSCPVARAQLQHTCAAHPAEVQVWHGAPLLRAAGCFQCVSGVSTFLGILVRTRNCNGSQCADPRAHKETAMVRKQLTPKCNRSNRCSFTKTRPEAGFPSVINMPILCQYGTPTYESVSGCSCACFKRGRQKRTSIEAKETCCSCAGLGAVATIYMQIPGARH